MVTCNHFDNSTSPLASVVLCNVEIWDVLVIRYRAQPQFLSALSTIRHFLKSVVKRFMGGDSGNCKHPLSNTSIMPYTVGSGTFVTLQSEQLYLASITCCHKALKEGTINICVKGNWLRGGDTSSMSSCRTIDYCIQNNLSLLVGSDTPSRAPLAVICFEQTAAPAGIRRKLACRKLTVLIRCYTLNGRL
jgi:hypothetical protein